MAAEESSATWDLHPANTTSWLHHHQNPTNSASNCDQDDVSTSTNSLANASNHSGLTLDSSARGRHVDRPAVVPPPSSDLIGEHASDNDHLWSHVLSSVRSNGDLRNGPDVGETLFEVISSKSTSAGIFESCCDYLKKIDGNWEFPDSSLFNNFIKNLNGYDTSTDHDDHQSSIESDQRLTKLSNLVSNWSIAPPDPQANPQFNAKSCHDDHISLTSNPVENYSQRLPVFSGMATTKNPVFVSCYGGGNHHHDLKMETLRLDMEAPTSYFRRAFKGTKSNGYQHHHHNSLINNSISTEADSFYGSMSHNTPCTSTITYSRLSKPLVDHIHPSKPTFRPLNLSDCKKQGLQAANSLQTRNSNGRTQWITDEGKKKRDEETSDSSRVSKKPKHENSTASSAKMHAPKVKLGDRITALQQIVSPFGKTDTASVLLEAIGYINFLQQQVQDPWGSLDRKDHQKGDKKVALRSRGLCLVPISCTPQAYHESTGSDYWTPTYKGCLHR
ncbi:uncharacterized protein LOC111288134 isoform X2 [Durio zibethinus]|uniref:Uncharacterized protein LOC111288134 isoform X2 n=1 Tax=Durio zibethinus TaxID=66656 RepID=A0A6P5Y2F9_DURZI|nr:uncharacterized protein LOC111288134 isoform X2 [Durio zibethinus]